MEEGEESEEEDPEDAHGVPVPGGAVDQDLAVFELARDIEASEGGDKGGDPEEEVDGVNASDEVEEMAALVSFEEDVLDG